MRKIMNIIYIYIHRLTSSIWDSSLRFHCFMMLFGSPQSTGFRTDTIIMISPTMNSLVFWQRQKNEWEAATDNLATSPNFQITCEYLYTTLFNMIYTALPNLPTATGKPPKTLICRFVSSLSHLSPIQASAHRIPFGWTPASAPGTFKSTITFIQPPRCYRKGLSSK